jgi:hypothetical protein
MMVDYKGYLIVGYAVRVHPTSSDWWRSQGVIFESQRAAQDHGLELCKKWVDENLEASDDV